MTMNQRSVDPSRGDTVYPAAVQGWRALGRRRGSSRVERWVRGAREGGGGKRGVEEGERSMARSEGE